MNRPLLALLVALGACAAPGTTVPGPTGSTPEAAVVAVLDGDSLVVALPGGEEELRLLGINAPEPGECFADEARDMLEAAAGDAVVVVAGERDQYGRLLGYAYRGSTNVNQEMVASGGALAMSSAPADFVAAEQDAVLRGTGMWAIGVCRSEPASSVSIYEVEFDAPGRDDENPNGEWVVVANDGAAIDLTGWIVRDESSTHRFQFPDGTVLDAGAFVMVRSGCGTDTAEELHWCETGPVWNNDGDTALLIDAGGVVVSRLRYPGD